MPELSKLQIRAKVMSVISQMKSLDEFNEINLVKLCLELKEIEDKETLCDIALKEFIKMDEKEYTFFSCILKESVNEDYLQDKVFEILKSSNFGDDVKYKLVQLLRIAGSHVDYNQIPGYFDNPRDVLDADTKRLLENAEYNPESMLDFLDFVSAVPPNDRNILLESLKNDYSGDILANIIYPILYSNFDNEFKLSAVNILSESKSSLAIEPFNYIIETSSDTELVNACKTGLKKLKLSGANIEKADLYFKNIIKDSTPADFYTTIPDGAGNQALFISRVNEKKQKYIIAAVVINDSIGISDCFGFYNITGTEISRVLAKFYQSEGKYKVSPSYIRTRIDEACAITIKNKNTFPYEFICWSALIKDIEPLCIPLENFVKDAVISLNPEKNDILDFLTKEYTFRWYITPAESEPLKNLTDDIYNLGNLDISVINEKLKSQFDSVFDNSQIIRWKNKLLNCCYLLFVNNAKNDAAMFKSILENENNFKIFKMVLMQRSVFNYFIAIRESSKESMFTTNIFRKKNNTEEKINVKKAEEIIKILKKNWINE